MGTLCGLPWCACAQRVTSFLQETGDTKQDQRANRTYADGRRETDVYQTLLGVFVCGCVHFKLNRACNGALQS